MGVVGRSTGIRPVQPLTVFTAHRLDTSVRPDHPMIAELVRRGHLIPVRRAGATWKRTERIGNYFLAPQKVAIRPDQQVGLLRKDKTGKFQPGVRADHVSEQFKGTRNVTLNPDDSENPEVVAKGVGSVALDTRFEAGPRIAFERAPLDFTGDEGVKRSIPERAFWGGGNLGTMQTAFRNGRTLQEAMERQLRARDPLISLAKRRGMASPSLSPIGLLQPLEYAFSTSPEFLNNPRYRAILQRHGVTLPAGSTTERAGVRETRAPILKIPAQAARELIALERKGEPVPTIKNLARNALAPTPEQVEGHRVFLYQVGREARVEGAKPFSVREPEWRYVLKMSGFDVKPIRNEDFRIVQHGKTVPAWKAQETLLEDFAIRLAANVHLVNHVLESTLTSKRGSSFHATNFTLSGQPVDLDEEFVWAKTKSGGDLDKARETLEIMYDKLAHGDYHGKGPWHLQPRTNIRFPTPEAYDAYFMNLLEKGKQSLTRPPVTLNTKPRSAVAPRSWARAS